MSYRAFKRLLGETSLERKCRFLFGAFILLLITGSFWLYARKTEHLAYDQITTTCRLLVNQVVADGELETTVDNMAKTIAGNAPLTVRAVKQIVREALKDESKRDMELCKRAVAECFASEDYTEGRTAFMEKRRPVFTGR